MRICALFVCAAALVATAADDKPPPGEGWAKFESTDLTGLRHTSYKRPLAGDMAYWPAQKRTSYLCKLDGLNLSATQPAARDELQVQVYGPGLTDPMRLDFAAKYDPKGKPTYHSVDLGRVRYLDLDGDGVIDCGIDRSRIGGAPWVMYEGAQVRVRQMRNNFWPLDGNPYTATNELTGVNYWFGEGKWQIVKP